MRYSGSLSLGVILLTLGIVVPASPQRLDQVAVESKDLIGGSPWEIDLAFSMKMFTPGDRQAISPDGKFVAFSVLSRPARSTSSDLPVQPRIMPNGTPAAVVGSKVFITDVANGKTKMAGPSTGNSWRPSWSPDGKSLAFFCDSDGNPQLWLYSVVQGSAGKLSDVPIKAKLWTGDEAYWSADSREVYVPVNLEPEARQTQKGPTIPGAMRPTPKVFYCGEELKESSPAGATDSQMEFYLRENNATLAAIDVRTKATRILVKADVDPRPSCLRLSPSGRWVSYLSVFHVKEVAASQHFYDLAIVPSAGGTVRVVAADLELPQRDYYGGTYRWRPFNDQLVYVKDRRLWFVDLSNGVAGQPRELAIGLGEKRPDPLLFTSDGSSVVVRLQASDSMAVVPLNGAEPRVLSLGTEFRYQTPITADDRTFWQPQPGFIALQAIDSVRKGVVVLVDLGTGQREKRFSYRGQINFVGSWPDERSLLAVFEDAHTPQDLYEFDAAFSHKKRLTNIEPRLNEVRFGPVESFETYVPRHDGKVTKSQTGVLLPLGAKRGDKLPTVAFIYGGSALSRFVDRYGGGRPATVPAQVLSTRGYVVLLLDAPLGPMGATANPTHEMADAILPQIYQAASLGYTDIENVALVGQSYGGYSTAGVISETNLFKAAAAISGLYNLPGVYGTMRPDGLTTFVSWCETGQGRMGTSPWVDLQRYIRNSPFLQSNKINTPLLILHGKNDYGVPVQEAEKMFTALKRQGKTAQLAIYEGEGHVVYEWSLVNAVDGTQRIIDFFDRYLRKDKGVQPKE